MNKIKFIITAVAFSAMAIALTSCGGNKPATLQEAGSPYKDVSDPLDELRTLCDNSKYYCGMAGSVSTNQQNARDASDAEARRNLAIQVQNSIDDIIKRTSVDSPEDEGSRAVMGRLVSTVKLELNDVQVQKTKMQYNEKEGKYQMYTLVSTPKESVGKSIKNQISNAEALRDAAVTKVFMDIVDSELNK